MDIIKDYENTYCYFHDYQFHLTGSENDDFLIYADKNRITQVIYNLVDNSIKYITEGGIISIISKKNKIDNRDYNKELALIAIKDTGSGIDLEILPHIFTKFASRSFKEQDWDYIYLKVLLKPMAAIFGQKITKMEKVLPLISVCL